MAMELVVGWATTPGNARSTLSLLATLAYTGAASAQEKMRDAPHCPPSAGMRLSRQVAARFSGLAIRE
jgi:hypothetical protein